ncbi:MAG: hypothetical protein M1827_006796 [Pycnora praestabilis]|nr:MAG: hypothetical protein M1827_006796 [Pycnora praestabilis]
MAAVTGAVMGLVAFLAWLTNPTYEPNEPPPVSHKIPVLGHVIAYARNRRGFLKWAYSQNHQEPCSVLVAGRKYYIFNEPQDVAAIHRKSKTLRLDAFLVRVCINLFGFPQEDADHRRGISDEVHNLNNKYLLRPQHYEPVDAKFYKELNMIVRDTAAEVDRSPTGRLTRDGLVLTTDLMAKAATLAFFGPKIFTATSADPLVDFREFIATGFGRVIVGVPRFAMKKVYELQDRCLTSISEYITASDSQDDGSAMMKERIEFSGNHFSDKGRAANEFSFLFALNVNAVPVAYISLLHVLTEPGLFAELRDELSTAGCKPSEPIDFTTTTPAHLPRFRAVYYETLRMHVETSSIREVLEPTSITSKHTSSTGEKEAVEYNFSKGSIIDIPATLLHFDEKLHAAPYEFHPKRFLDTSLGGEGTNPATTLRPFGGGVSYCPGRMFAEKEIVAYLASMVLNFDLRITNGEKEIPISSEFQAAANSPRQIIEFSRRKA